MGYSIIHVREKLGSSQKQAGRASQGGQTLCVQGGAPSLWGVPSLTWGKKKPGSQKQAGRPCTSQARMKPMRWW